MSKWRNFSRDEFACQCGCGTNEIHDSVIDFCQQIRDFLGGPIIITSGFRCDNHPVERAKTKPGTHAQGLAADIACSHTDARKILEYVLSERQGGVGVHQKGQGRFIHVDISPERTGLLWTY